MIATSSAYATTLQPPPSRIRSSLLTAIFHKMGDSTPPCWVPLLTSLVRVEVPSVAVTILLISNLWISLTIGGLNPSSVRDSVIAVGSTLLTALSISRKAISVYSLMLSDFSMLLTTKCSADLAYLWCKRAVLLIFVSGLRWPLCVGLSFFQSSYARMMLGLLA